MCTCIHYQIKSNWETTHVEAPLFPCICNNCKLVTTQSRTDHVSPVKTDQTAHSVECSKLKDFECTVILKCQSQSWFGIRRRTFLQWCVCFGAGVSWLALGVGLLNSQRQMLGPGSDIHSRHNENSRGQGPRMHARAHTHAHARAKNKNTTRETKSESQGWIYDLIMMCWL